MPKKEESSKIIIERTYNIPLSRETLKVPPFKKANKAIKTVRQFISRHMKSEDVDIGRYLNLKIWNHGAKNPPHKVKVNVTKNDKGKVFVELVDAPKEMPKAEDIKKSSTKEGKIVKEADFTEKPELKLEKEIKEKKEEKAEEAKKIEHEEIKELKREHPIHHAPKVPPKSKMQEAHPPAPKSI